MNLMVMVNQQRKLENKNRQLLSSEENLKVEENFSDLINKVQSQNTHNQEEGLKKAENFEELKKKLELKPDLDEVNEQVLNYIFSLEKLIINEDFKESSNFEKIELEEDLEKNILNSIENILKGIVERMNTKELELSKLNLLRLMNSTKSVDQIEKFVFDNLEEIENIFNSIDTLLNNDFLINQVTKNNSFLKNIMENRELEISDNVIKEEKKPFLEVNIDSIDNEDVNTSDLKEKLKKHDVNNNINFNNNNQTRKVNFEKILETNTFNLSEKTTEDFIEEIVEKVKVFNKEKGNFVEIQLKPAHLGKVSIELESIKGEIITKIKVDNYKIKNLLESNLDILHKEIDEIKHDIKSVEVYVSQDSDFNRDRREREALWKTKKNKKIKNINLKDTDYNYKLDNYSLKEEDYIGKKGINLTV